MKVLILEDDENRIEKFKELMVGAELYITHLTTRAIELLNEVKFDTIFLDHDLADEHYKTWENPGIVYEDTGLTVARYLADNPHLSSKAQIVVHTMNPYGRENMLSVLKDRNVLSAPFTSLVNSLIINN